MIFHKSDSIGIYYTKKVKKVFDKWLKIWFNSNKMNDEKNQKNEPLQAILVSIKKDQKDIKDTLKKAEKFKVPQGPAFINGQWW